MDDKTQAVSRGDKWQKWKSAVITSGHASNYINSFPCEGAKVIEMSSQALSVACAFLCQRICKARAIFFRNSSIMIMLETGNFGFS